MQWEEKGHNMQLTNMVSVSPIDTVDDSFQAFLVEDATFTKHEEYPILRADMIASKLPKKIMPFNKAINFQGDLSETFICFFSPDPSFERVRRNPKKYVNFFKRTAGIIGFDFSIHSDMPIIKQKTQINDNLSLSFYYGNMGIPVITNIRCGVDELLPEFLESIPKKLPIAIGTHGFIKTMPEKYEWYCFIDEIINKLTPSDIVVYGPLKGELFDDFRSKTNIVCYTPWISNRWREAKNVN